MLEASSYMVSNNLPFSSEEASNNAHNVLLLELKKRLLDVTEEEGSAKKVLKVNPRTRDESMKFKGLALDPKIYEWSDHSDKNPPIAQLDLNSLLNCIAHSSLSDFAYIASTNKIFWSFIKSNELYRMRRANGLVDHLIYISCGESKWQAYDPNRDRWLSIPTINYNQVFFMSDKQSLTVGNQLLVFGRDIAFPIIYQYSFLTNRWTSGMEMNYKRYLFGSASLGEIGIIAGGNMYDGKMISRTAEMYNSETEKWTVIPSMMNKTRRNCSSVFMDGKYYVIGGETKDESGKEITLRCGEFYDAKTEKWTLIPNMLPERGAGDQITSGSPPLVAVAKDQLYAAYYAEREVLKYNQSRNDWTIIGKFPPRTASTKGWGMAFRAYGDHLVIVGGPRSHILGILEIHTCVPRDGELLQWKLLVSKRQFSYVYNCAIMGC